METRKGGRALRTTSMHHQTGRGCGDVAVRAQRSRQSGFILTLELLIILTILGTVVYFALDIYQRWLIASIDPMGGNHVLVYDANGNQVVRARSFVGNEGPMKIFRVNNDAAAILGTRLDGFTSRQRIYFTDFDNPGSPCTCDEFSKWVLDPTLSAGAAVEWLRWSVQPSGNPTPVGPTALTDMHGHPISDFYTTQAIAFAVGPAAGATNLGSVKLFRSYGSLSTSPPLTTGFDPTVFGYPACEWASERYGANRCRTIGTKTTNPALANNEQAVLAAYLMAVDDPFGYDLGFTPSGGAFTVYAPDFWSPAAINPVAPVPVVGTNQLTQHTATNENDAKILTNTTTENTPVP